MEDQLVKITFHGEIGDAVGKNWNLAVASVGEAMRAVQINSDGKLYPYLFESCRNEKKYEVLVDDKPLDMSNIDPNDIDTIRNSELLIERKFSKLDIVPVLEGGIFAPVILGAVLLGAGILLPSALLIMVGLGLIISGLANLLASPPDFEDFREFEDVRAHGSYLFNGPQNAVKEGGPVPVGYGRLLVGTQLIGASYKIAYQEADDSTSSTSS